MKRAKHSISTCVIVFVVSFSSTLRAETSSVQVQERVAIETADGGLIYADVYGNGERGVVLAHGGRFNKESWAEQAEALAAAEFRVLAIDFRGYGESRRPGQEEVLSAPLYLDVLAAVRYLKKTGVKTVAVVGGSMGGGAAANASIAAEEGEIDRLVLLAAMTIDHPECMQGRKLFIVADNDTTASGKPRLIKIREQFEKAPEPKALVILEGYAHAQYLFQTEQSERLMREILKFLSEP